MIQRIKTYILFFLISVLPFARAISATSQDPEAGIGAQKGKIIYGVASFYSKSLDGSETSTGETFHQDGMTGASNFFKLNAWVRVTNISNGKSVIVRINDRMHQRMADRGRVLDLSRKAAGILGYISKGLTRVKLEEVPSGTKE